MNRKRNETRVFQERTNSLHTPKSSQHPKASVVFECAQGFDITFKGPIIAVGSFSVNDETQALPMSELQDKRTQRYHAAETALARSFIKCQDQDSIQDIRISSLHRAFSVLNAHAADAKHSAEKLRTLLANREADPKEYQFLQQQRWREEKRKHAAEEVSQTLKKQVSSSQTQPQPRSKPSEDNLVQFLTDSRHRIPFHLRHSANFSSSYRDRSRPLEYPRRVAHNSLIPLSLKAPKPRPIQPLPTRTTKKKNLPLPELATTSSSPVLTMPSSGPLMTSFSAAFEPTPQPPSPGAGTALIYREHLPPPGKNAVGDLSVTMPSYVADLLSEFDDNVANDGHLQTPFTKQPSTPLHKSASRNRISTFIPESLVTRFDAGSIRKPKRTSMAPPSSYVTAEPPTLPPIVIESDFLSTSTPSVSISQSAGSQEQRGSSPASQRKSALARLRRKISALRQN